MISEQGMQTYNRNTDFTFIATLLQCSHFHLAHNKYPVTQQQRFHNSSDEDNNWDKDKNSTKARAKIAMHKRLRDTGRHIRAASLTPIA